MSYKIVNTIHVPGVDFGEKLLEPLGAELLNAPGRTEEELIEHAADADAVICSGPVQPWTANVVNSLKKCRIIASLGVGYDRIDLGSRSKRSGKKSACSTMTFFQSTSNSSARIMGMDVFTLEPNSGLGDMRVITPLSPILM